MKKKQTKSNKPANGFGSAMSALNDLCFDYGNLDVGKQLKKQAQKSKALGNIASKTDKTIQQKKVINNDPTTVLKQQKKSTSQFFKIVTSKLELFSHSQIIRSNQKIQKYQKPFQYDGLQVEVPKIIENPNLQMLFLQDQVKQGSLGDCYLISAISCLAGRPNILNRIIEYLPPAAITSAKYFVARLFDSGMYKQIVINNTFPVNNFNEIKFAKPINGDISVMIIEKAYAQMYGGYDRIDVGYSCDALRDLTGSPTEYIDLANQAQVISKITTAFEQNYVLTISSKSQNLQDPQLISKKHCYSIHNHKILKIGGKDVYFLKLKNPGGGILSKLPPEMNAQIQKALKEDIIQEHGVFWLPFKIVKRNFEVISSCLLHPKYFYTYKVFSEKELNKNHSASLFLKVQALTHGYISINQKHKRHFDEEKYDYEVAKIIVAQITKTEQGYKVQETLVGNFSNKQTCTVELSMKPGEYMVFLQLNNIAKSLNPKQIFTVSFYTSSKAFELYTMEHVSPDLMLINYIKNHEKEFQINKSDKMIRYFGDLFGYVIIYYQNISTKTAHEQIDFTVVNVSVQQRKFEIAPKGTKLIKNIIGRDNNCSHKCQIKTHTLFKG